MNSELPTENKIMISSDKKEYLKNWRAGNNEKIKRLIPTITRK